MESTRVQNEVPVQRRRALEAIALALTNGLLLGVGFTATSRPYGLLLALGIGTTLSLSYVLTRLGPD